MEVLLFTLSKQEAAQHVSSSEQLLSGGSLRLEHQQVMEEGNHSALPQAAARPDRELPHHYSVSSSELNSISH